MLQSTNTQTPDMAFAGLDIVRVIAIGLVTMQHVFSLLGHDEWTSVGNLSIGQIGVAMFLVVSGLLASTSKRPSANWLVQRLRRLFPAYWITIAVSFVLAGAIGHKSFDAWQVIAQLAGIGLFTHGANIINTPTWFVSLLLVCYLATFVGRVVRAPMLLGACASIILAVLVASAPQPWLSSHFFTYSLASTITLASRKYGRGIACICVTSLFLLSLGLEPAFGYTAVAFSVVGAALQLRSLPRVFGKMADNAYEYYLVHGLVLYGMIQWVPSAPMAVVCGIGIAATIAVALRQLIVGLEKWMMPMRCPEPPLQQTVPVIVTSTASARRSV